MFIGHFGTGFAGKAVDKKPSLAALFFAAQFIDLLWPFLLLAGIEKVEISPGKTAVNPLDFTYYPFSHSLAGVVFWGLLIGAGYYFLTKNRRGSLLMGGLVVSHWFLDLLVHIPDLPLAPGLELRLGFGIWNSALLTVITEGVIFAGGLWLYLRSTKSENYKGHLSLWSLVVFLISIYVMNFFSPPPPDARAIGYVGLSQWLIVAWGYWIEKTRSTEQGN